MSDAVTEIWAWQKPNGEVVLYKKLKGAVGARYEVQVTYEEDKTLVDLVAKWIRTYVDDDSKDRWTLEDNLHRVEYEQRQENRKIGKEPDSIDIAMAPLHELSMKCRTRPQRDALIATVIRRLTETW